MKVARYMGAGNVSIVDEPVPVCPPGGLLVRTEACGLCSGELMAWYMDQKIPHVLGHEVAGLVISSEDDRFPEGSRVFPHHHAPCGVCELCLTGREVHCAQWKSTKLIPGGMAEYFAVAPENLTDTIRVDDLRPIDAALIEPLACVVKSCGMGFQPMRKRAFQARPSEEINKRQGANLPHWTRDKGIYFVTFRLADSVPKEVSDQWRQEREELKRLEARGRISIENRLEYERLLSNRISGFLDSGKGACVLKDHALAEIVSESLKHFDGERYRLYAWCVMPNHVHVVVEPLPGFELEEIVHSWKSFSANEINKRLGQTGSLWQSEAYDHWIRNEDDLSRCLRYVGENPLKANLKDWPWVWVSGPGQDGPDTHGLEAHATAVIGLGVMGLMHLALLENAVGYDLNPARLAWAKQQGFAARHPEDKEPADTIFVCPGTQKAFDFAVSLARPGATIVMFAPLSPGEELRIPQKVYFQDLKIVHSYSCGPRDTQEAAQIIREGKLKAEQVVSDFITIEKLPEAYRRMKDGEILKAMVTFP